MPLDSHPEDAPSRIIVAVVVVALTVFAVWKVIDYRTQPPEPAKAVTALL